MFFSNNSGYVGLPWVDCKAMYTGTIIYIVSGTMQNVEKESISQLLRAQTQESGGTRFTF